MIPPPRTPSFTRKAVSTLSPQDTRSQTWSTGVGLPSLAKSNTERYKRDCQVDGYLAV